MRHFKTIILLAALAATASTASAAGTAHWYCSADGIKSWTSNVDSLDAKGWAYSGDRTKYKDDGHCNKS